jgi:prepilin-type processing-associated H-X9-DG protein
LYDPVNGALLHMCTASRRIIEGTCVAATLVLLAMLLLPDSNVPRRGRRTQCMSRMRNVSLALQTYATNNQGQLPPAYIVDASGRPSHSWRVLLLPYLGDEARALYEQYHFDEPWNGPNNSKLAELIPETYQCPEDVAERDKPGPWTSYVAVVGPHTMWPGDNPGTLDRIPDGASHTLLLVELRNSGIHWMEPRDLDVATMAMRVNPTEGQGVSSVHRGSANVMYADGHGETMPDEVEPEILRKLIEITDGGPTYEELP